MAPALAKRGWRRRLQSARHHFTLCLFPPLSDQLRYKVTVFRDAARYNGLCRFYRLFRGAKTQFSVSDSLDHQFIARLQAGRRAAFRRDYNPPLLVDARPMSHDINLESDRTIKYGHYRHYVNSLLGFPSVIVPVSWYSDT